LSDLGSSLGFSHSPAIILFLIFAPLLFYIFYFIPFVYINSRLQYYVEHNENNEHNLQANKGEEGRGGQKRWREERKVVTEQRQEGLIKLFVTKMGRM
jgi:hypothetical protein